MYTNEKPHSFFLPRDTLCSNSMWKQKIQSRQISLFMLATESHAKAHTYKLHIHISNDFISIYDIVTASSVMRLINEYSFEFKMYIQTNPKPIAILINSILWSAH